MNVIRKCKAILRIKSKSNSSISVKHRAMAVLEHDLRQAKSAFAKEKFDTGQYLDDAVVKRDS